MVLLLEEVNVANESRYYINQTMKSNQMDLDDVMAFIQYFIKIFKNRWNKISERSHVSSFLYRLFESDTTEDFENSESSDTLEEAKSSEVVENLGAYSIVKKSSADFRIVKNRHYNCNGAESSKGQ